MSYTDYTSEYSLAANRAILQSIGKHGLASPDYLAKHEPEFKVLGSQDEPRPGRSPWVFANLLSYRNCKENPQLIAQLTDNGANGISAISMERRTDPTQPEATYERTRENLSLLLAQRLHNVVLFEIDAAKMANQKEMSDLAKNLTEDLYSSQMEERFQDPIPFRALKRAFVPKPLTALFKSVFPKIECVEIPSIPSQVTIHTSGSSRAMEVLSKLDFPKNMAPRVDSVKPNFGPALKGRVKNYVQECEYRSLKDKMKSLLSCIGKAVACILSKCSRKWSFKLLTLSTLAPRAPSLPLIFHLARLTAPTDQELQAAKEDHPTCSR